MNRVRLLQSAVLCTLGIGTLMLFGRCSGRDQAATGGAPATAKSAASQLAEARARQWEGFTKTVEPFLAKNCVSCHGGEMPESGVRLEGIADADMLEKKGHVLTDALRMIRQHKMPPSDQEQPKPEDLKPVVAWMDGFAEKVFAADLKNPGHVTMRRMNRAEYNNTIQDLLAIDIKPANAFPEDDAGFGFDNNGDVLSLAPVLMDKYITAAELSLDRAIMVKAVVPPESKTWDAGPLEGTPPKVAASPALAAPPVVAAGAPGAGGAGAAGGAGLAVAAGRGAGGAAGAGAGRGAGRGGRGPAPTGRVFTYAGDIHVEQEFEKTGHYILKVKGYGVVQQAAGGGRGAGAGAGRGRGAGPARPQVVFKLDGNVIDKPIAVVADFQQPAVYAIQTPIEIKAGKHEITLSFVNGATKEEAVAAEAAAAEAAVAATQNAATEPAATQVAAGGAGAGGRGNRGGAGFAGGAGGFGGGRGGGGPAASPTGKPVLGVLTVEAEGPIDPSLDRMPESFKKVFTALPSEKVSRADAAKQVIATFTTKAFRRPVTDSELKRLMGYWETVEKDETFERSISLALQPVLASPNFLYRVEAEPGAKDGGVRTLNDYELATRLSYFLWSSLPDDELMKLAAEGKLRANLQAQVKRMLTSPKAQALCENFAGQWLQLRKIAGVQPDDKKFPGFDEGLRESMLKETQMFFLAVIQEDRSVLDFLDADFTYVNGRLAKHYGIAGVTGEEFKRVSLTGTQRGGGGLITQASVLTITSYPNRTSPVLRGKWVLENLLDAAPPPPPPNVPTLEASAKDKTGMSLRELMEAHRTNPTCISCHSAMDPIGFGLENFNAVGQWRDKDPDAGDAKIDASGKLPEGQTFSGPAELKKILLERKDEFVECLVGRMLTYALGRGMDVEDRPRVKMVAEAVKKDDYKFSALIMQIVSNDAFQKQGTKRGDK